MVINFKLCWTAKLKQSSLRAMEPSSLTSSPITAQASSPASIVKSTLDVPKEKEKEKGIIGVSREAKRSKEKRPAIGFDGW